MDQFSISQLSRFSGIKPHTIRIWEQRYNALKPIRSEGNTRYYDNTQLRRLLNITSLMENGFKVSELGGMPDEKLFHLLNETIQIHKPEKDISEYFTGQLIAAGMSYDEPWFEKIFAYCQLRYGMKDTYVKVLLPMLERIGLMWASDVLPPAYEHFISNILRQKLFTAIDTLPPAKTTSNTWLLFEPEEEFHEIGLLMANYLIRASGGKTIYLGSNVPLSSLVSAVKETNPAHLLLFFVHRDLTEERQAYIQQLSSHFPSKKIHIAGSAKTTGDIKTEKNIQWLHSVPHLLALLPATNI